MNHFNRAAMATFGRCFLAVSSICVLESNLAAVPTVYTGTVVTDVRVGATLMHNASLKITFVGDTNNIRQVPIPSTECNGLGYFLYLPTGVARMQIKFHRHTFTARLEKGQIFVDVDACNGGIGFGSFIGPNGLEPAYPLALTLGTAEYASVNFFGPLTGALTVTGSAWSCIGYPPGAAFGLPGTPTGNCLSPDTYPLKSDIGDIFVYQPYWEDGGGGSIFSNHSGSTNRGAFLFRPQALGTLAASAAEDTDPKSGVVYTLQTVADGSIGSHVFNQALVTFRMISNTRGVTKQPSPLDATKPLYENRAGYATVRVDDNGTVMTAKFDPGEVYVRYDTAAGVAGFGSEISPNYPIALNCANTAYPSESSYTTDCFQGRHGTISTSLIVPRFSTEEF